MNNYNTPSLLTVAALFAWACTPAGTQAHDMSADEHQAAAANEEQQASEHGHQHDVAAVDTKKECVGKVCWTVETNPTEGHAKSAEEHHQLAAKHREASQELQSAEAKACSGLDDADRDISPFAHGADIRSVSQLHEEAMTGKNKVARDAGATIVFQPTPGLTEEWLQRIVNCHVARNAAVGHEMPEMEYCPLVPRGAQATVRSIGDGFAVDVRADDADTAAEIWRRAQLIKAAH